MPKGDFGDSLFSFDLTNNPGGGKPVTGVPNVNPTGADHPLDPTPAGGPPAPNPFAFHFPEQQDFGALFAQQAADAAAAQEAALRAAGEQQRDQLYSDYLNAASTATDFINSEIAREQSNASLLGIDYSITDEGKTDRISNYFASIWGEGDQSQLEGLFSLWGNPAGFSGFDLERGDAAGFAGPKELPGDSGVATTTGTRPKKKALTSEEETLGSATLLGA